MEPPFLSFLSALTPPFGSFPAMRHRCLFSHMKVQFERQFQRLGIKGILEEGMPCRWKLF
jgi:hypothetical protein